MIRYLEGDATNPPRSPPAIIVHICNDVGGWGKGFVLAISRRWSEPERVYRAAFSTSAQPALGDVQFVAVADGVTVANLIGQHDLHANAAGEPPIRYAAVRAGLSKIAERALRDGAAVHMPRIGCGLAGGKWEEIEPILRDTLVARGVSVTVYDLPRGG